MKRVEYKRLNITLPETTVTMLERVTDKGERSNFIDTAIKTYIRQTRQNDLKELLKEGAVARSKRDLDVVDEWFGIEEEA